jgi:hypothetical protein
LRIHAIILNLVDRELRHVSIEGKGFTVGFVDGIQQLPFVPHHHLDDIAEMVDIRNGVNI